MSIFGFNWRSLIQTEPAVYRKLRRIRRAGQVQSPFGGTITSPEARRQFKRTLQQYLTEKAQEEQGKR